FPGVGGRDAEKNPRQFRAARADEAGEADDFTSANFKVYVTHTAGSAGKIFQREHATAWLTPGGRINLRDLAANHHFDERSFVHRVHRICSNALAIAQHGDAVGELENFFEPM